MEDAVPRSWQEQDFYRRMQALHWSKYYDCIPYPPRPCRISPTARKRLWHRHKLTQHQTGRYLQSFTLPAVNQMLIESTLYLAVRSASAASCKSTTLTVRCSSVTGVPVSLLASLICRLDHPTVVGIWEACVDPTSDCRDFATYTTHLCFRTSTNELSHAACRHLVSRFLFVRVIEERTPSLIDSTAPTASWVVANANVQDRRLSR